jgi:hypothetical protein
MSKVAQFFMSKIAEFWRESSLRALRLCVSRSAVVNDRDSEISRKGAKDAKEDATSFWLRLEKSCEPETYKQFAALRLVRTTEAFHS